MPSTSVNPLMIRMASEERTAATPYASPLQIETPITMKRMRDTAISMHTMTAKAIPTALNKA